MPGTGALGGGGDVGRSGEIDFFNQGRSPQEWEEEEMRSMKGEFIQSICCCCSIGGRWLVVDKENERARASLRRSSTLKCEQIPAKFILLPLRMRSTVG